MNFRRRRSVYRSARQLRNRFHVPRRRRICHRKHDRSAATRRQAERGRHRGEAGRETVSVGQRHVEPGRAGRHDVRTVPVDEHHRQLHPHAGCNRRLHRLDVRHAF